MADPNEVDLFPNIEAVFIGKRAFTNDDIQDTFSIPSKNNKQRVLVLFKKVFQNIYPITRSNGIPLRPKDKDDATILLEGLNRNLTFLRHNIINMKNRHGDSVKLRELLDQFQEIKILIEHFTDDNKQTFPYDLLSEYVKNEDYLKYKGNFEDFIYESKQKDGENDRIKSLLRQFAKLYLTEDGLNTEKFMLLDPGTQSQEFLSFKDEFLKKDIPPILKELFELLEKGMMQGDNPNILNESNIQSFLEKLEGYKLKINELSSDVPTDVPTDVQIGGQQLNDVFDETTDIFDLIINKYNTLRATCGIQVTSCNINLNKAQNDLKESVEREAELQGKVDSLEASITILGEEATELQKDIRQYEENVHALGKIIEDQQTKEANLNANIESLGSQIENLQTNESNYQENLDRLNSELVKKQREQKELEASLDNFSEQSNKLLRDLAEAQVDLFAKDEEKEILEQSLVSAKKAETAAIAEMNAAKESVLAQQKVNI